MTGIETFVLGKLVDAGASDLVLTSTMKLLRAFGVLLTVTPVVALILLKTLAACVKLCFALVKLILLVCLPVAFLGGA